MRKIPVGALFSFEVGELLKNLFSLGLLGLLFLIPSINAVVIPTNCSQPLSVEGAIYVLEQDLNNVACILAANYTTLDCQGHAIIRSQVYTKNPNPEGLANITIRNCFVLPTYFTGITIHENVNNALIENNTLEYGINGITTSLNSVQNITIKRNHITSMDVGVLADSANQNIYLQDNFICFNKLDVWCYKPTQTLVFKNSFNNIYQAAFTCQLGGLPASAGSCDQNVQQLETSRQSAK